MATTISVNGGECEIPYPGCVRNAARGKVSFIPDAGVEFVAWMMMMWERENKVAQHVRDKDPQITQAYTRGVVASCEQRMAVIQSLIESARDSWSASDWTDATIRVGMMLAAKSDDGKYLHRLGGWMAEDLEVRA